MLSALRLREKVCHFVGLLATNELTHVREFGASEAGSAAAAYLLNLKGICSYGSGHRQIEAPIHASPVHVKCHVLANTSGKAWRLTGGPELARSDNFKAARSAAALCRATTCHVVNGLTVLHPEVSISFDKPVCCNIQLYVQFELPLPKWA